MGALPYFAAVVTALLGYFGAQFTAVARLQKTLLDASRQWVADSQAQHARDGVRILELEAEVIRQRGTIDQGLQREASYRNLLKRSGIDLPIHIPREDRHEPD